jgi:hypothetical protein
VIINIHAASSDQAPNSPAPVPANLPTVPNFLGVQFMGNLSDYIYTEFNLKSERQNLNGSWYTVPERFRPVEGYYSTTSNEYGILSTHDGWPSESYIELSKSKRLLLGWGTVDPQMAGYNFSGDSGIVFPNGFIQEIQTDIKANDDGQLTTGCFLRNGTNDVSQVNSSWAAATRLSDFKYPVTASAG